MVTAVSLVIIRDSVVMVLFSVVLVVSVMTVFVSLVTVVVSLETVVFVTTVVLDSIVWSSETRVSETGGVSVSVSSSLLSSESLRNTCDSFVPEWESRMQDGGCRPQRDSQLPNLISATA